MAAANTWRPLLEQGNAAGVDPGPVYIEHQAPTGFGILSDNVHVQSDTHRAPHQRNGVERLGVIDGSAEHRVEIDPSW